MEEVVLKIDLDAEKAEKNVKSLTNTFEQLKKKSVEVEEELKKTTDPDKVVFLKKQLKGLNEELGKTGTTTEKAGKKGKKGVGLLSKGFKMLGTSMKAAGIGLIVSLVVGLGAAFTKNQRFVDAFSTVMETIGIVFSQVATALFDVYDNVSKSSENFDALGKVLKGLVTIGLTPLKLSFFNIKLALQSAQLVWEKSFFGGNDKKKITDLIVGITETKTAIFDTGKAAVDAGKDIVTNFGEAITETANIASQVVKKVGDISVDAAIKTAKTNVQIKNSALLAVAEQGRLLETYDRLAEKQRQIRDDESKSITERQIANDKLGEVLKLQEKAQIRQADLQIAAAQADANKNNNIEAQVALVEALANREGVLAAITGFQSEQDVNRIALKKEEIELNQTITDAEKERRLAQLEFEESQTLDPLLKLEKEKERLELENKIIADDLERKKELFAEGTQSRVDAEQLFLTEKQRIDNEISINEKAQVLERFNYEKELENAKKNLKENTLSLIGNLAAKGSAVAKALAIREIVMEQQKSIAATISATTIANAKAVAASPLTGGQPFVAINTIQAGIGIASGLAQAVKSIGAINSNSNSPSGGSSGGGGGSRGGQSAPSFNLVQGTDSNQIAQSINGQNNQPVEAYVVSGTMTTQQEADRNKQDTGSI